jgi:hypothetical protein
MMTIYLAFCNYHLGNKDKAIELFRQSLLHPNCYSYQVYNLLSARRECHFSAIS